MAKKTVKLNEPVRDAEPFDHGVRITYKGATIAQSADDAEYDLLTENTIVEENINVQLVNIVPPVLVPFKVINNTTDEISISMSDSFVVRVISGGLVLPYTDNFFDDGNYILPIETENDDSIIVIATVDSLADKYEVLMNGVPVSYDDRGGYLAKLTIFEFTAATHFTITVNDKAAGGK